jgi:predicted O-methyltransferase YrrM
MPKALVDGPTQVFSMSEEEFYRSSQGKKDLYDLILSDADHGQAETWFDQSVQLLRDGGILVYHDYANPNHPNLATIPGRAMSKELSFLCFASSSRNDEACERGLLVIQKSL